ncbi:capsular exopolysaccharide synthesis family protein [Povalibacter uvarum]|uniref:Capsular exopolysaccharide synthesis family protein n=1 Tax=Povalibacter uvarum TaxID=732238 RepID=A0A841HG87_9GAMM|nr:CpsD/CapB family tyrosine-protein kinase [Povalibacter uvarum]MBB6091252.1 capsular exopolysaccharide synthesis family protein [Povalibacter uvarum]
MEKITRALERAFAQRSSLADGRFTVVPPQDDSVEFTDTVMFRTPAIELDPQVRENERILPPNAAGPYGGAYKMLRTRVLRELDTLGATTLGVMSAASGEGKTLTAINLAIAIAADPARTVLLVDFDLRNPSIHRRFHHEPTVGVDDCLIDRRASRDAMFKVTGYERLTVLPARAAQETSSELLASSRTAELVAEIRARYANRIVIFDLPPVLQADDALAFSRNLQAGLLVMSEGKTRREDVTHTLELLKGLPFVGTVLNGSRERIPRY